MTDETGNLASPESLTTGDLRPVARPTRRLARMVLDRFACGTFTVELPSGEHLHRRAANPGPHAVLKLNRWRSIARLVTRGDIGFAEGYMDGDWTTPDLPALLEFIQANERKLSTAWRGSLIERVKDRFVHARRANTRRGSRRNITAHYDLGNDFYAAWLDPTMTYSSGIYRSASDTLEQAQDAKLARVCELMTLRPGLHVLEIGCGWGALAQRLITHHGAHVTGLTLSREQQAVAQARVQRADSSGRSHIHLQDYRDCRAQYDRIVSIEMMEATGEAYWPTYFATLRDNLVAGGTALLQVITIDEPRFTDYRRRPDFIQRYIFPGGMLPTKTHMRDLAYTCGLQLDHVETFGTSYARTLQDWRGRFLAAWPSMTGDVASLRFRNMWDYYLIYCSVGFAAGAVDVGLYRLRKPY